MAEVQSDCCSDWHEVAAATVKVGQLARVRPGGRIPLDGVVREGLYERIEAIFRAFNWNVVTLKYGVLQRQAFAEPGGDRLKAWIDTCPNDLYSALMFRGGAAWRERLPGMRVHETDDVNHYTILMTEAGLAQILPALRDPILRTPASDPKETPA